MTLLDFETVEERNIYTDLLREFRKNGHRLYVVSPVEKRKNKPTYVIEEENVTILKQKIGNTQKTNIIEKGISTLMIEPQFISGIKHYFADVKFDLVLYSTPPITFAKLIEYVKKRDGAKSYLLLKDIFPQNAVDIGMMAATGPKSVIYKLFRKKEERLYALSDHIGCMSQANVDFLLTHNPRINPAKVHINPNSFEVVPHEEDSGKKAQIYEKYNIPAGATTFIYGGNLGKPQDIPFIVKCLQANAGLTDRYFVICGTGTEWPKLQEYVATEKPGNVLLLNGLPRTEYEDFVKAFDVGLIFLDHRFTIPNFPSRLLSYMQAKMPILACTDPNTDIGKVITEGEFGWWCESNDAHAFTKTVDAIVTANTRSYGDRAYDYLQAHYTAQQSYEIISQKVM